MPAMEARRGATGQHQRRKQAVQVRIAHILLLFVSSLVLPQERLEQEKCERAKAQVIEVAAAKAH
jgi:hypothetical protein